MGLFSNITDKRFYHMSTYIKNMSEDEVTRLGITLFSETIGTRKTLHRKLKQTYWRMSDWDKDMMFTRFQSFLSR